MELGKPYLKSKKPVKNQLKFKSGQTMTQSKQKQSAGDYSTQIQAESIINNTYVVGIDEARARGICKEEYAIARQNWTQEANAIAEQRVQEFEDRLMPKMAKYDASLSAFSDPGFQITLRKAQISAASTERFGDFDMLSELLLHRVEQNGSRDRRLGITKAIEIVDQIDDVALVALSLVYAISKFSPISNIICDGLNTLNSLYEKIISGKILPSGTDWMEHLDLLSAIRLGFSGLNSFKKLEDFLPVKLEKYFRTGIQDDGEEYVTIIKKLDSVSLNKAGVLISNPLKQGFSILALSDDISQILVTRNGETLPLSEKERVVIQEVIEIMKSHDDPDEEVKTTFWRKWDEYPYLKIVHNWWNDLPVHFNFTPVGIALSNAYIHGVDNAIPCMY